MSQGASGATPTFQGPGPASSGPCERGLDCGFISLSRPNCCRGTQGKPEARSPASGPGAAPETPRPPPPPKVALQPLTLVCPLPIVLCPLLEPHRGTPGPISKHRVFYSCHLGRISERQTDPSSLCWDVGAGPSDDGATEPWVTANVGSRYQGLPEGPGRLASRTSRGPGPESSAVTTLSWAPGAWLTQGRAPPSLQGHP